jgi:hypothetical protein
MTSKERILKITTEGVFLTPDYLLPWSKTNLPTADFTIKSGDHFWKVTISDFDRSTASLQLQVEDYYSKSIDLFQGQQMKFKVGRLYFKKLAWSAFEDFLSIYKFSALSPFLDDDQQSRLDPPKELHYLYKIKCYLKDTKFKLGYLSVWTALPALADPVELQIKNHHLLPEFEFIKSYFSKVLKRKTFEVEVSLRLIDGQIKELHCVSKQIDKINEDFIKTLKHSKILALKKNPVIILVDKHLFSTDDIFDQYDDDLGGNIFKQDPGDIIAALNELGIVRNRKQLEYLAGRKQEAGQKILITLAPHLGFLFIVIGARQHHFIWELVDSHATYVWSFEKTDGSLENQLRKIEELVGLVREQGRDKYKQYYQQAAPETNYLFRTIIHKHASAGIVDGFPNWRYRLEEILE